MTDVSHYSGLKQKALMLYKELSKVRKEIKVVEDQMILEVQRTQGPLTVTADNRKAVIRVQDRCRRVPLTEADLKEKLSACLIERFGATVALDSIAEFALTIAKRIWSERRVKQERRVSLKISS
jgi:hypothetical protein